MRPPLLAYSFRTGTTLETPIMVARSRFSFHIFTPLRTLHALFHHLPSLGPQGSGTPPPLVHMSRSFWNAEVDVAKKEG